ncbi:MAG: hypothetical protein Q4A30_01990 [Candidatus Saccharibacteria bacterium]|nr:hypothetical protein [Candidatus Saccharibacteria bacterium]
MNNYQPVLTQDEVVALLGRPLSEVEAKNFNIYLEIADLKLRNLLCLTKFPSPIPTDLKMLLAKMFGSIKATQDFERENGVTAKKVEDFSVNYSAERKSPLTIALSSESATSSKYSQCSCGIMHGKTML